MLYASPKVFGSDTQEDAAIQNAEDDDSRTQTDGSTASSGGDQGAGLGSRFDTGRIALRAVFLLMWLHSALRVYKACDLFVLLGSRCGLGGLIPALASPSDADVVINWLIVLLSLNVITTLGTLSACLYVSVAYVFPPSCVGRPMPTERRTKHMLRTVATMLFYLALLPDALATLGLSSLASGLVARVGERLSAGRLSVEATATLAGTLAGCCCPNVTAASLPDCWIGQGGSAPLEFLKPVRRHLRFCYLPEVCAQMALILIAFVVTHLIRAGGRGEAPDGGRCLLPQTATFCRLPDYRQSLSPHDAAPNAAASTAGHPKKQN